MKKQVLFILLAVILIYYFTVSYGGAEMVTFTDVSDSAGVSLITPSWGVSWGDVNADGWEDIYVSNHMYHPSFEGIMIPPSLFLNQGDGTFQDVRDVYGLVWDGDTHGAMWGDFNNDGYPELFQARGSNQGQNPWPNSLYLNKGELGYFEDIAVSAGIDIPLARGRGGCWFEYDDDNLLDLYVCNVLSGAGYPGTLYRNRGDGTFEDIGEQANAVVQKARGCTPLDYDNDGLLDLFMISTPVNLLRNNGDGTYEDVTQTSFPGGKLMAIGYAWGDYDNDGNMDLYLVGSDVVSDAYEISDQSIEYITEANFGTAHGVDFDVSAGSTITFDLYDFQWRLGLEMIFLGRDRIQPPSNPFSLAYNDVTAEGDPGFVPGECCATFIWHENNRWHIRSTNLPSDPSAHFTGVITTDGQFTNVSPLTGTPSSTLPTSRLYRNLGDGTFTDATLSAGLSDDIEGIATTWLDVDNDGDVDLYIVDDGNLYNAPNKLYVNNGDGTFTEMAAAAGAEANVQGRGENVAYGDYNNDGFLDLFVTNGKGAAPFSFGRYTFLHNNGNGNHWLKIRLIGTASNRDGVGAKVTLTAGGQTQVRQQTGGVLKYAQNSSIIHFGLGAADVVEQIEVAWPSGITHSIYNVTADQLFKIQEPSVGLTLEPQNTTLFPGEMLQYTVTITNRSARTVTVDAFGEVATPKAKTRAFGPIAVTLNPGDSVFKEMSQEIPVGAPLGVYHYKAYVGKYDSSWPWAVATFHFSVVAP